MAAVDLDLYRNLLRPLLFRLPAEQAQKVAEFALKRRPVWGALAPAFRIDDLHLSTQLCGIPLENPIGLAAGFDKNCEMLSALAMLGFGYLTCGTVTESARPGNPKPRMLRLAREQSLINALGFPNKGVDWCARQLEEFRSSGNETPLIVSISGTVADEIVRCHRRLEPLADAVEVNISSPNTAGLRAFHERAVLGELMERINESRTKPLMVKMPPYPTVRPAPGEGRDMALALAKICRATGVDALTVANSKPTKDSRLSTGTGGLSGKAVFDDTLRMVAELRSEVGDKPSINACGGIFSGDDAWRALKAGAATVQLYTSLIYRGPSVAKRIKRELLGIMDREGAATLG